MIIDPVPDPLDTRWEIDDLCPEHRRIFQAWRRNTYNPRQPRDWPGGQHIADSRTSHAEREQTWRRKNIEQMMLTAELCRRGDSPQCNRAADAPKG